MKQKKSKITIIAVWILLCGCVVILKFIFNGIFYFFFFQMKD